MWLDESVNKTIKGRILMWIVDGPLYWMFNWWRQKIMESPVANLTVGPFSKDPRKIPDLLNKYLETVTQNRIRSITNSLKPNRQSNLCPMSRSSFLCIERTINVMERLHGWENVHMDYTTKIWNTIQNDKNVNSHTYIYFPDRSTNYED